MGFGELFPTFFDSIVELILGIIRAQFSEIFALIDLFQALTGGGV